MSRVMHLGPEKFQEGLANVKKISAGFDGLKGLRRELRTGRKNIKKIKTTFASKHKLPMENPAH
jgi:hypothetical protein